MDSPLTFMGGSVFVSDEMCLFSDILNVVIDV